MKLPHLAPLIFAKEVISLKDHKAKVLCEFEELPTFGVFIETAAQASAAFFQDGKPQIGYLANVTSMELLQEIEKLQYIVNLAEILCFEHLRKYSFFITETEDQEKIIVKGEFTIAIE